MLVIFEDLDVVIPHTLSTLSHYILWIYRRFDKSYFILNSQTNYG